MVTSRVISQKKGVFLTDLSASDHLSRDPLRSYPCRTGNWTSGPLISGYQSRGQSEKNPHLCRKQAVVQGLAYVEKLHLVLKIEPDLFIGFSPLLHLPSGV